MKTKLKMALAILASAAMPLVAIAPAQAIAIDRYNITLDCSVEMADTAEDDHNIAPGDVAIITFRNCDGTEIWDNDNTGNAFLPGGTVIDDSETQVLSGNTAQVTVDGEADLEVNTSDNLLSTDLDIDIMVAGDAGDPSSTLLTTEQIRFGLGVSDLMIREADIGQNSDSGSGGAYLDGNAQCEVEPGNHIYKTLEVRVAKDGTYDFRTVNATPFDEDMYWGVDKYPSGDPVMALYENFDPTDPEANIVACNANSDNNDSVDIDNLWSGGEDSLETGTGFLMDNQWPWFRVDLEPGTYTLVNLSYNTFTTENFDAGVYGATSNNFGETWVPTAQTNSVEIWGPEGGLAVGEGLAPTGGVEPSFALWAGLGIAGVGVAMAVARRRAQRA